MIQECRMMQEEIVKLRRDLHRIPELGCVLPETCAYVEARLKELGIPCRQIAENGGILAEIDTGKPGKTLLLRADMDALPVPEETGLPFSSEREGRMHACGHDAHTAMLLGAARILYAHRSELHGTVKFLFQMGEEIGTESRHYVEKGALDGVDAIFGQHIWNLLEHGTANLEDGPRMACSDRFTIRIHGKAAHGSAPQNGRDSLVAAAAVVMALQTLVSRQNDPRNTFVLTVGMMNGGTATNIISAETELVGTTRTFDNVFRKTLPDRIRQAAADVAAGYGCSVDCTYFFGPAPLINDHPGLNEIARSAYRAMLGEKALVPMARQMGAEDFSVYMEKTPGVFGFLGSRNEAKGLTSPHHHPDFEPDEDVLPYGTGVYAYFAYHFLNG